MANLIGQSLGRYHVLKQLGEGGMAVVYKAFDTRLKRNVAIKVILPGKEHSEKFHKRFEREAKALAQLSHPNIVKVIDYGEYEGLPYLVMEYLPGGTLKQKLVGKPMPWREAVWILIPIARALAYAHERKIVHRDIKPSNILITESGEPMLSDFGIAKMLEAEETLDLTGTGVGVGTPEYMSPEQAQGQPIDGRSDVYSLGIVLYEMVTGRKPYQADTPYAVVIQHVNEPLPRPTGFVKDLPNELESVLLKALAKGPVDRYSTMKEFVRALEIILGRALHGLPESNSRLPSSKMHRPADNGKINQQTYASGTGNRTNFRHSAKNYLWRWGVMLITSFIIILALAILVISNSFTQSPIFTEEDILTLAAETVMAMFTQTAIHISVNDQYTDLPTLSVASPTSPVIAPIEGKIVFLNGTDSQQDLFVLNTKDNNAVNITNNPRNIVGNDEIFFSTCFLSTNPMDISFDGTKIAYVVDTNPDFNSSSDQIVSLSSLVSGQSRDISQSNQAYCNLVWSPDGTLFAFTSAGAPLGNKLFIADQHGQVLDDISLPDTYIGSLYWIKSNELFLTMDQPQKLYKIFMDNNLLLSMTEFQLPANANRASVSPNGKYLAIEDENGVTRIFDLNGNTISDLGYSYLGYWSKSGRSIVNNIPEVDADWLGYTSLLVGSTETSDITKISPVLETHYKIQSVFWSPTEKYFAMLVCENHSGNTDTGFEKYPPCEIFLSTTTGNVEIVPNTSGNYYFNSDRQVAWSPDGTRLAFVSSIGNGPSHLRIIDIAGNEQLDLGEASPNTPVFWIP